MSYSHSNNINIDFETASYIGEVYDENQKYIIGSIEERLFGTKVLGRIEENTNGTDLDLLLENIEHVLKLNLLNKPTLKNGFIVQKEIFKNNIPCVTVRSKSDHFDVFARFWVRPIQNLLKIRIRCNNAPEEPVKILQNAVNEVIENGSMDGNGWGQFPF